MSDRHAPSVPPTPLLFSRRQALAMLSSSIALAACGGGGGRSNPSPLPPPVPPPPPPPPPVTGPAWFGYGRDAQHTAASTIASQDLGRIAWTTPVDLAPQYTPSGALLTHYGSPVVTTHNTVVLPVKKTATGGYRVEGRNGANGTLVWSADTDYVMPPHNWLPPYSPLLTAQGRLYVAGAGGKLLMRSDADAGTGALTPQVFYGAATYNANAAAFDGSVFINTPLTADAQGNLFFGFQVTGANPAGLVSGIARVAPDGTGTWVGVAAAAGDATIVKPVMNCAPALSNDGATVYIAANRGATSATQNGVLLALNSTTLATRASVALLDPNLGGPARLSDDGTAACWNGHSARTMPAAGCCSSMPRSIRWACRAASAGTCRRA
jgi:hypothetical protein